MKRNISMLLIIVSLVSIIIISGCTSSDRETAPIQGNGDYQNNNRQRAGNFGNLSEEQRQQFIEQRMQMMMAACQDKKDGDSCALQNQRGQRAGTCKAQQGKLMCSTVRDNKQGNRSITN